MTPAGADEPSPGRKVAGRDAVMRILFLGILLLLGLAYTSAGWNLDFALHGGRPGPGFFPRIVGVGLVAVCAITLALELRPRRAGPAGEDDLLDYGRDTLRAGMLMALFIAGLMVLGGTLAIAVYLIAALSLFNRGHTRTNLLVSVGVAISLFLLFDRWLKIELPAGLFGALLQR